MADLLNTGMRLRHFRILRGMTQKSLGVAVGFPESSADVRIAQYESGARTPKQELLCRSASSRESASTVTVFCRVSVIVTS